MAAFKQDFIISQSDDCKTLTFTDNSNFGNNDENYNFSTFNTKNIGVYDSTNTLIGSLIPIVDSTPVTFTLDKDRFLYIIYTLQQGSDTPLTKTYTPALSCFVDLKYGELVAETCSCEDKDTLFEIVKTTKAAQIYAQRGNAILSQEQLDLANQYSECSNSTQSSNCGCN